MGVFRAFVLAGIACLAFAAQAGDKRLHADWVSDVDGGYTEAFTTNESGAHLGMLCFEKCVYYYRPNFSCRDGAVYSSLISSAAGASPVDIRCAVINATRGPKFALIFTDFEQIQQAISGGGSLGIAIALKSGEFNVSRFSLDGVLPALGRATRAAAAAASGQRSGGNRDTRL